MNKKIIFPVFILFLVGIRFMNIQEDVSPVENKITKLKKQTISEPVMDFPRTEVKRTPAQIAVKEELSPPLKVKLQRSKDISFPTEAIEEYGLDKSIRGLPRGMVFASALKAVTKDDYSGNLGAIIKEHGNMVYFRPSSEASDDSWNHVVYDPRTSQVYPLSTVIKVLAVNDHQRSDLINKGLEEYYYHDSLQLFYTQSSNSKLLTTVDELKKMGLEIELEAVKDSINQR